MNRQTSEIHDDKAHVRGQLDLSQVQWRVAAPEGADPTGDWFEVGFVPHTDGVTYTVMRKVQEPEGTVLVFTPVEWEAFVDGAAKGEFDGPWE